MCPLWVVVPKHGAMCEKINLGGQRERSQTRTRKGRRRSLGRERRGENLKGFLRMDEILLMVQKSCQPVKVRCLSMFISLLAFLYFPGAGCCCINYYMIEMNLYASLCCFVLMFWIGMILGCCRTTPFWLFAVFWMQSLPTFLGCSKYIRLGKRDVFAFPPYLALLACSKPPYFDGCGRQKRPRERRRTWQKRPMILWL